MTTARVKTIQRLVKQGATDLAIASELGLTKGVVSGIIYRNKLRSGGGHLCNPHEPWTDAQIETARSMAAIGHSITDIARQFGIARSTTLLRLKAARIKTVGQVAFEKGEKRSSKRCTEENVKNKWTDERVAILRDMWGAKASIMDIAAALDIGLSTVADARRRFGLEPRPLGSARPTKAKIARAPRVTLPEIRSERVIPFSVDKRSSPPQRVVHPVVPMTVMPVRQYAGKIGECTYPVSGERKSTVYCDAKTLPGKSYCAEHHALCFRPPPARPNNNPHGNPWCLAVNGKSGSAISPTTFEEVGVG